MRKARQPFERIDRNAPSIAVDHRRDTPVPPAEDIEDAIAIEAMQAFESLNAPVQTPTPLAPLHDVRHPTVQNKTPGISSEVIVVSSDSDDDNLFSTKGIHGSTDTEPRRRRGPTQAPTETSSKRALQLMLDRDREFYESLERDLAQRDTQRNMSEAASSSVRMESMVPDVSTSYDTSTWAPTRTDQSYESCLVAPLQPALSPASQSHQVYHAPPRAPTPINPQAVCDAYGHPIQPVYLAPPQPAQPCNAYPAFMLAPAMSQGSGFVYASGYRPDSRHYPEPQYHTMYQPAHYPQHPQSWSGGSASPTPVSYPSQQISLASYARPKSPRQASKDKVKADCELTLHLDFKETWQQSDPVSLCVRLQWCTRPCKARAKKPEPNLQVSLSTFVSFFEACVAATQTHLGYLQFSDQLTLGLRPLQRERGKKTSGPHSKLCEQAQMGACP